MRFGSWARLLCAAIPFVAGCAGFWQDPNTSSSSGCSSNCSTASSGDFYILNAGTSPGIVGNSIASGKLTGISGSPWSLPSTPFSMALAPSKNYLYVSTIAGVYVYPISSGVLGSYSQVSQDVAAVAVQVDTTGNWLIEALQAVSGVTMAAVPLNSSTGAGSGSEQTASFSVTNAAVQTGKIAISPDDKYVFVALGAGGAIAVPFNSGASSGTNPFATTAFTVPVVNSGGSTLSVAADPLGRVFYVGETLANSAGTAGGLLVYNYSSLGGTLTQASGSPISSGGLAPNTILPNSSGSYVYVGNGQGTSSAGNVTSFAMTTSGTTYTVATGSSTAAGIQPFSLAVDSSGSFLMGVNSLGNPYFSSFTFDTTTAGKLDAQIFTNTGASPLSILAVP